MVHSKATDPLGSPRVITNKQSEVISRRDFMPFGEEVVADATYRTAAHKYGIGDGVRQKFTGYERDEETGLDFAEARYYYNDHGRFTAVDPLLASGKSANPQTFNRYAYTMNRPLILTDPTGLQTGKAAPPEKQKPKPEPKRTSKNPGDQLAKRYRPNMVPGAGGFVPQTLPGISNGETSTVEVGTVRSGKEKITVFKNKPSTSKEHALDTNCHGLTFTNGAFNIDNGQVEKLITGEGLTKLVDGDKKQLADIAIYRDADGNIIHSATVSDVNNDGGVVSVSGLGGIQLKSHTDPPEHVYRPMTSAEKAEQYRLLNPGVHEDEIPCFLDDPITVDSMYNPNDPGPMGPPSPPIVLEPVGTVKLLSRGEIDRIIRGGVHPHDLKPNARFDLYKDQQGNIFVAPKGGRGSFEPTGHNVNDY